MSTPYFQSVDRPMPRVIAALTMQNGRLVRTRKFSKPSYVGDPINAVKIFNEKGADEIVLLEIGNHQFDAARVEAIREIAGEAFMPISYGGGIRDISQVREVIRSGFEKVVLNTALHNSPALATEASKEFGAQAVVASIEVGSGLLGSRRVHTECGSRRTQWRPVDWARRCEELGCGEIILTSIDRDGSMQGYDIELIGSVAAAVGVPVIALGGAGSFEHLRSGIAAGASAAAAGSMFVYYGPLRAVLISYPDVNLIHQ
jgi:cyclase